MLRTWDYAGWKPVVGIFLALIGFVIVSPVVFLPILRRSGRRPSSGDFLDNFGGWRRSRNHARRDALPEPQHRRCDLGDLGDHQVAARMRPRWLASVMPKLRWNFLLACLGVSVLALARIVRCRRVPAVVLVGHRHGRRSQRLHRDDGVADADHPAHHTVPGRGRSTSSAATCCRRSAPSSTSRGGSGRPSSSPRSSSPARTCSSTRRSSSTASPSGSSLLAGHPHRRSRGRDRAACPQQLRRLRAGARVR